MTAASTNSIADRLRSVLREMREQSHLANQFGGDCLSFDEEMEQVREYIEDVGEYGIAYECVVSMLEKVQFVLSGKAAINLLEVALLFGYKTERPSDKLYDRRGTKQ
jgi:hypothetical protein